VLRCLRKPHCMGEISLFRSKYQTSFLQSYGYINILCHIFNSARNTCICFNGKERLHFILNKTKVNAKLYVETLLLELVRECRSVLPWGAMLERYKSFQPKPENISQLKKVLQLIWDQLPQDSIKKAILSFPKT